jgi:plasmid stabilization system protein ParE
MKRFTFARHARADLDEIWAYIAREGSVDAAHRVLGVLRNTCCELSLMPGMGADRPNIGANVRAFVAANYRIYYEPNGKRGIHIIRVLHCARDEKRAFGKP